MKDEAVESKEIEKEKVKQRKSQKRDDDGRLKRKRVVVL